MARASVQKYHKCFLLYHYDYSEISCTANAKENFWDKYIFQDGLTNYENYLKVVLG